MKTLIFSFILITFGIQLQAEDLNLEKYHTTLDHVEFQSDVTYLYLSNGTIYSYTLLKNEILQLWNIGDHIDVAIDERNQGSLLLQNLDSKIKYFPQVTLELASLQNLLTIERIDVVRNLEFASIQSFKSNVLLSDGSSWERYFSDDLYYWREGDRILISAYDDSVTIINWDLIQTVKYESGENYFRPVITISIEKYPTIQKIEIRKEDKWSSYPTATLTLSDGSRWRCTLYEKDAAKLEIWFIGDRVIVDDRDHSSYASLTNYNIISTNMFADASLYFDLVK